MTKQQLHYKFKLWLKSDACELGDVYKRYGVYKTISFKRHKEYMEACNGKRLRIVGHNGFEYTLGFVYTDEADDKVYFTYITKCSTYQILLTEGEVNELHMRNVL